MGSFPSGWKGYAAGIGLMLYGIVLGIDVLLQQMGYDLLPDKQSTIDLAVQTFLLGLGVLGIRHKLDG